MLKHYILVLQQVHQYVILHSIVLSFILGPLQKRNFNPISDIDVSSLDV